LGNAPSFLPVGGFCGRHESMPSPETKKVKRNSFKWDSGADPEPRMNGE
jgi:hypothetical protein